MSALFDRTLLSHRRRRFASKLPELDYLWNEMAAILADRLQDVTRSFAMSLVAGSEPAKLAKQLISSGKVEKAEAYEEIHADEEGLPFSPASFDLMASAGHLHWVNDLPGWLSQAQRILKPGGLFLAVFPGARSLHELREALMRAEMELTGGVTPRISPLVDVKDAGSLLQRAGFEMPVVDVQTLTVTYPYPLKLMQELQGMGQASAMLERSRKPLRRDILMKAAEIYAQEFSDAEGRIVATFDLLTLTGWKPA